MELGNSILEVPALVVAHLVNISPNCSTSTAISWATNSAWFDSPLAFLTRARSQLNLMVWSWRLAAAFLTARKFFLAAFLLQAARLRVTYFLRRSLARLSLSLALAQAAILKK